MQLLGSYDFYEDKISDFCVTLMCDYHNGLIAFANRPSKLKSLEAQDEPIYLDFGGGEGFWFKEFPENLLAKDGFEISFDVAKRYFPYLKDEGFWVEESLNGYSGIEYKNLTSQHVLF